jgi:hypothetical protein
MAISPPNAQGALTGVPADINKAAHNNASTGGIWNEKTKSYTFAKDQHIEIGGSYIDVSGMEVQIDENCEYSTIAVRALLKNIKPAEATGIKIIPFYLKQNHEEEEDNLANSTLIQNEVKKIIEEKKKLNPTQVGYGDETTILIPYIHTATSQGKPSNHFSLLALKFNNKFTKCEPFSITTSGDNAISAENVNKGIKKAVPSGIEVFDAIDIVTMQQNGSIPTVDCGAYMIQNAENIAALGLVAATFSIDKNQKKANQPIEGRDVNLRGISLRAEHAITIALKENIKPKLVEMVGGESAADNLAAELKRRIALKKEKEVVVDELTVISSDKAKLSIEEAKGVSKPAPIKVIKTVAKKQISAEILETKLREVVAADESIFFHLGKIGKSTEELKVKINEAEIVVKREENNQENKRARPIITPQIISLHQNKSQHRAEFGGVVFDETGIEKVDEKNQEDGIFNDADLKLANFRGCKFNKVDFSSIDPKVLSTISFVNCEFENCNFPKDFKFQQYQFKFKQTANFDLENLTSKLGNKEIPKGIPADKFEDEPSPKPEKALAEKLKLPSMARE